MTSFDQVEAAQRVRDIIRAQASEVVAQNAPRGLVGRVVTLDPSRLKGTVWFPGDDHPIEVNFFAGSLPASWQEKDRTDSPMIQTSTQGYGGTVIVQRFNGQLYVTDILTGGQFGFKQSNMGLNIVNQQPNVGMDLAVFDNNSGIVGETAESTMSVRVGFSQGLGRDAVVFGPFVFQNGTYVLQSNLEVTVRSNFGFGGVKKYSLVFDPHFSMQNSGGFANNWWRLLPYQEMVSTDGIQDDYDLDVKVLADANSTRPDGIVVAAIWFRIIHRSASSAEVYDVTVTTGAFDKVGGFNIAENFVQYQDPQPIDPVGYIGFHNSYGAFEAKGNYTVVDTFNRQVTPGWGSTEISPDQETGLAWISSGAATTDYGVEVEEFVGGKPSKFRAFHQHTNLANSRSSILGTANYTDVDLLAYFSLKDMPLTQGTQVEWIIRYRNGGNDRISCRLQVNPDGSVQLILVKSIASVVTTVGSTATAVAAGGFVAGNKIGLRAQMRGTTVKIKAWVDNSDDYDVPQPNDWQRTDTIADSSLQTAGQIVVRSTVLAGSTVPLPTKVYFHRVSLQVKRQLINERYAGQNKWNTGPWRSAQLRIANTLQRTWTCDGSFIWDGNNIRWAGTIWMEGVGRHRNGLRYGRTGLRFPATGEWIPRLPNNFVGSDKRFVTSSGVTLSAGEALYVGIPPGVGNSSDALTDFLFIVTADSSGDYDYSLPEWTVLIASRPKTGPGIRLGDGRLMGTGSTFALYATTDSAAIGGEAVVLFVDNWTYKAGRAYRVSFGNLSQCTTASASAQYRLRDQLSGFTNDLGEYGRYPSPTTANQAFHTGGELFVANNATADLTGKTLALTLTCATGTATHRATSGTNRWMLIEDWGEAAAYSFARAVV